MRKKTRKILWLAKSVSQQTLSSRLRQRLGVQISTEEARLDDAWDLILVDPPALEKLRKRFPSRRKQEAPAALPVLLVVNREELPALSPDLQKLVDDLLVAPFADIELEYRLTSLLRLRELSLRTLAPKDVDAQQEIEERYRYLTELISDYAYAFRVDPDGSMRGEWVTESFQRVFGFTLPEIDARGGWQTMVYPEDLPVAKGHAQKVLSGESDVCEMRFVTRDGEVRWLRDYARPVFDATGRRVVRIYGLSQDISARKAAEERLQQSEANLRSLIEARKECIWSIDREYNFLIWNRTFEEFHQRAFGARVQPGKSALDLLPAAQQKQWKQRYDRALSGERQQFENVMALIDGEHVFQFELCPIFSEGEITGVSASGRDITERKAMEKRLREIEERFRIAFQTSPDSVNINRLEDGLYVDVNEGFERITGFTREETIGRTSLEIDIWADPRDRERLVAELKEKGVVLNFEAPFRMKDGRIVTGLMSARIIDLNGVPHILSITRDIEHLKQMEAERRRLLKFLDESLDFSHTIVWRMPIRNREGAAAQLEPLEELRGPVQQVLGYSMEELKQQPSLWYARVHSDDRKMVEELTAKVAREGGPAMRDYRWQHPDGHWIWIREQLFGERDTSGQVAALLGLANDITDLKEAELRLRALATRLQTLREVDKAILAAKSVQSISHSTLARLPELIPCQRTSLLLLRLKEGIATVHAVHGKDGEKIREGSQIPLRSYRPFLGLKKGETYYVEDIAAQKRPMMVEEELLKLGLRSYMLVPLLIRGELIGSLNLASTNPNAFTAEHREIAREVADQLAVAIQHMRMMERLQRHAEELEQKVAERTAALQEANDELKAFSYSVSHDLRAPLRAIDGFSRIILEDYHDRLDAEGADLLQRIRKNTQRMAHLIDDLLEFSRISRREMKRDEIDMSALAKSVFQEVTDAEQRRRMRFTVSRMPKASGDTAMIRQVVFNLLSNAVKFSSVRDVPVIKVGGRRKGRELIFYVKDNGVGFDPKYAHKLFGIFQRLHTEEEFEGTGVGLSIARRIINRHGGRMWAEAEPGKGATFYFSLPTAEQMEKPEF